MAQRAAEWFVHNRDPALRAENQSAFFAWLRESPACVREYLAIAALAEDLQGLESSGLDLPALEAETAAAAQIPSSNVIGLDGRRIERVAVRRQAPDRRSRRLPLAVAAAALVAILSLTVFRDWNTFGGETFRTAHGEQRIWQLRDGSVVQLNSDSAVVVKFSGRERLVRLERGQAFFKVAHETVRRFRVSAGFADVVAVGTQFDVYRRAEETLVTVVEGRVAVFEDSEDGAGRSPHGPGTVPLPAGQQARIARGNDRFETRAVDVRNTTAWTRKQIVLDGRTLSEVVQEFNRYSAVPIVLNDAALGGLRLGGVFDAYDSASFLEFLKRLGDIEIEPEAGRTVVHRHEARSDHSAVPPRK